MVHASRGGTTSLIGSLTVDFDTESKTSDLSATAVRVEATLDPCYVAGRFRYDAPTRYPTCGSTGDMWDRDLTAPGPRADVDEHPPLGLREASYPHLQLSRRRSAAEGPAPSR